MPDRPAKQPPTTNPYPFWAARFWHGMPAEVWFPLLWRHCLTIRPSALGLAATVSFASLLNTGMRLGQRALFGRRAASTPLVGDPVFIVGHWRSGTTLLHELLVLDEQFASPTTYQCFAPDHFLVSEWWVTRLLSFLLPAQRPMDNMVMGWTRPQEDEFALCNMGIPSPYLQLAFPRDRDRYLDYLDFDGVPAADVERWQAGLRHFLQLVTYRTPQRLVLKSPPHLGRMRMLLEMFPGARFVHIVRDPCAVYASTVKLWSTLHQSQSFQNPPREGLDEYIFGCFERMYAQFDRDRDHLGKHQLCEVRYEDLVHEPVAQMEAIYEQLELGDFEAVRPKLLAYFENARDYRTNQHRLDEQLRQRIHERWGRYMQRFGYCQEPLTSDQVGRA